jgi:hypothetical protein
MFKQRSSGKKQDLNPEISDKASHFSIHEMGGWVWSKIVQKSSAHLARRLSGAGKFPNRRKPVMGPRSVEETGIGSRQEATSSIIQSSERGWEVPRRGDLRRPNWKAEAKKMIDNQKAAQKRKKRKKRRDEKDKK